MPLDRIRLTGRLTVTTPSQGPYSRSHLGFVLPTATWFYRRPPQIRGLSRHVAEAVRVVRESGLPNRADSMFTTIEGEWDEVMDVVRRACEAVDAPRVGLTLKADIRPGVEDALTSKVERVERYLSEG